MATMTLCDLTGLGQFKTKLDIAYAAKYVAQVEGKGLSTNDLTNELLAQIGSSAENAIESIQVNGVAQVITDKTVNLEIITTADVVDLIESEIEDKGFDIFYVPTDGILPSTPVEGTEGKIYCIPDGNGGFDEYRWTGTAFDKIGSMTGDFTGYLREDDIALVTEAQIDALFE